MLSVNDPAPNGNPKLSPITAAAVSYIARGFRVVSLYGIVPLGTYGQGKRAITIDKPQCACQLGAKCQHPGKHPRFKKWQNGQEWTLDEINREWTSFDNIGILTGEESRIWALDVDPRHGGDQSLIELITEFGRITHTLEIATGGGGRLLIFRWPGRPVPNSVGIRPGIDLRGDGGLIVAPPSMHISGRPYTWDGLTGFDAEIGMACPRLTELVCGKKSSVRIENNSGLNDRGGLIRDGEKHYHCIRLAGAMRNHGASQEQIFFALRASNFESAVADDDLRAIARDASDWHPGNSEDHIVTTRDGTPRALLGNAIITLRCSNEWSGVLAFNEFSKRCDPSKKAPFEGSEIGRWDDRDDTLATAWLQRHGIHVTHQIAGRAIQAVARDRPFHPVREYFDSLKWDGKKRIKAWLNQYLGVEHNDYSTAVGERWLTSAVARVFQPGCKVDCCLILEGRQGIGKSTALRTMGIPWFTDEMPELGTKDAALQTQGVLIIEMSEIGEHMNHSDVGRIKSFMSRSTDRFRPPWAAHASDFPRQCVFCGSGNLPAYLRDETGARRFWPVRCTRIHIDRLAADKDQLWAESVQRYRAGLPWHLDTPELSRLAEAEQAERYDEDPWHEGIVRWLGSKTENISLEDVIRECTNKPRDQWTQDVKNRVARTLRALGWEPYRVRIGGSLFWRYRLSLSL